MMATPEAPRRPKLSLQIKPAVTPQARTRKSALANANPRSPTTFNTLSNVYVTAIERSTPVQSTPITAINTHHQHQHQPLKLQTDLSAFQEHQHRVQSPFTATTTYPDTPLSANPISPAAAQPMMDIVFPSQQMTATPPLSAGPTEPSGSKPFNFDTTATTTTTTTTTATINPPQSPAQARRRAIYGAFGSMACKAAGASAAPYSHNRSLHSILRNSPLPPAMSPSSPRRQSRRLQEKAARRVGYESPLTQTITTEKYTRSHIELLAADDETSSSSSPYTPSPVASSGAGEDSEMMLDLVMMSYPGDGTENGNTRDGGQTPGPFEEMRRRMTTLGTGMIGNGNGNGNGGDQKRDAALSPRSDGGVRKNGSRNQRKRKEKKRMWVWTIGNQEDELGSGCKDGDEQEAEKEESGAIRAIREAAEAPLTEQARAVPLLAPPLPPARRRSVNFGGSNSDRKAETTPEPVTAILRTSAEQHHHLLEEQSPPSESEGDHQYMDVEMSDVVAPEPAPAPAPAIVVKTEDQSGLGDQHTESSSRRDTPIPPDLVVMG